MSEVKAKGETHGCIVCGKLYQLYVVHDANGNYIGSRVMSAGGREVKGYGRPLVACDARAVNARYSACSAESVVEVAAW